MQKRCVIKNLTSYDETIPELLQAIGAQKVFARQRRILIKPNLVNASPPPVTLAVDACAALIKTCRQWCDGEIVIGEGTGDSHLRTDEVFHIHGYDKLAENLGVELVDLNEAELLELRNPANRLLPTLMIPRLVMESFVISAALLKAHSLARVTLTMKNMIGVAPPSYYQRGGFWKKSAFHEQMHASVFELNRYRKPDLAFIDASIGLVEHHLRGRTCDPPANKLLAGFDPVAVDAAGAQLLGVPWWEVEHIRMADGVLGQAEAGGDGLDYCF